MDIATAAGALATAVFLASTVPMVWRAAVTRDMSSYSRAHLVMTNVGNAAHSLYVLSLPAGPIYVLHGTHVAVALFMLVWHLRHAVRPPAEDGQGEGRQDDRDSLRE